MIVAELNRQQASLSLGACITLCLLGPLSGLAFNGLSPVMPQINEHFASVPHAGMLVRMMVSGFSAAMIIGALASGFLAERIGEMRLLLLCLIIYAFSGAVGYYFDDLYLIVASRLVVGAVNSAAGVLAMALITTRIEPHARDRWLGFYLVSGTVGALVLLVVVGELGKHDWRYVFLLHYLALPIALLVLLTLRRGDAEEKGKETNGAPSAVLPWKMIVLGLVCGAVGATVFMYLPFHLEMVGMGRPEQVASVMVTAMAFGGVTAFAYGWVRKFATAVQVFVVAFGLAAAGLLISVSAGSYFSLLAGMALYGGAFGIVTPNLFGSCAAAIAPTLRPRFLGMIRAAFYAGALVMQAPLEFVVSRMGPAAAIHAVALLCLVGLVLAILLRHTLKPIEPDALQRG